MRNTVPTAHRKLQTRGEKAFLLGDTLTTLKVRGFAQPPVLHSSHLTLSTKKLNNQGKCNLFKNQNECIFQNP